MQLGSSPINVPSTVKFQRSESRRSGATSISTADGPVVISTIRPTALTISANSTASRRIHRPSLCEHMVPKHAVNGAFGDQVDWTTEHCDEFVLQPVDENPSERPGAIVYRRSTSLVGVAIPLATDPKTASSATPYRSQTSARRAASTSNSSATSIATRYQSATRWPEHGARCRRDRGRVGVEGLEPTTTSL